MIELVLTSAASFALGVAGAYIFTPKVRIVKNRNRTNMEDEVYVGIYPTNGLPASHLTHEEYQKGVHRSNNHPEDKAI